MFQKTFNKSFFTGHYTWTIFLARKSVYFHTMDSHFDSGRCRKPMYSLSLDIF